MHLVGFIIRICHDARSLERQSSYIVGNDFVFRGSGMYETK